MASDLLSIALSGTRVARGALDITAQNIANASSEGYVRRSLRVEEVSSQGGFARSGDISLFGARIAQVRRNADPFRQAEMRRTGADLARASTELDGLRGIEGAVEQSDVYSAIVEFEAGLKQLAANPVDSPARAAFLAASETLAGKFQIAGQSLQAVGEGLRFDAGAQIDQANGYTAELARINQRLSRAGSGDNSALLDQRDDLLERLSTVTAIRTEIAGNGTVAVTMGDAPARDLVRGGGAGTLAMTLDARGVPGFTLGGEAINPGGGALAGATLALSDVAATADRLDTLAATIADTVNQAQANGAALDGSAGQPIFAGTSARDIRVVMTDGAGIATAPAGSPAGSRDTANLTLLRDALTTADPAGTLNDLLFDVSSKVAGRKVTHDALDTIAASARTALDQQSGVDLDQEAANLIRFQQAFQASGRAMQVASDIFDTLMGIGR